MQQPGTYQTRFREYARIDHAASDEALSACGELYGNIQRKLFAEVAAGRAAALLKSAYLVKHWIPARMFNGVRVSLEGRVASVKEQQKLRVNSLGRRTVRAGRQIADAAGRGRWVQVHQKRRRLVNVQSKLAALEADIAAGLVRLCFGSKRLWRKQHHLTDNGYSSLQEWLADWQAARSDGFFVLGSRDETAGCQLCVASIADDGSLTLRLRLPDCLAAQRGKYPVIQGLRFAYGHEQVLAAVESNAEYLAVVETDASGNQVHAFSVPLVTYGKSQNQAEAIIGDAVARVVACAGEAGKPIVIEKLEFRQTKAALEGQSRRYSGMLSTFCFGQRIFSNSDSLCRICFSSGLAARTAVSRHLIGLVRWALAGPYLGAFSLPVLSAPGSRRGCRRTSLPWSGGTAAW